MLKKTINSTTYLISSILFSIGCFLFIFKSEFTIHALSFLFCLGILLDATIHCIFVLTKKQKNNALFRSIFDILFALFIYLHPNFFQGGLSVLTGIYLLLYSLFIICQYIF